MPETIQHQEQKIAQRQEHLAWILGGPRLDSDEKASLKRRDAIQKELDELIAMEDPGLFPDTPAPSAARLELEQELRSWESEVFAASAKRKFEDWEYRAEVEVATSSPEENFNGFQSKLRLEQPPGVEAPFSEEQVRLYLKLILPGPLREFFDVNCKLRFSQEPIDNIPPGGGPRADLDRPENTGGIQILKEAGQFVFVCDTQTFQKTVVRGDKTQFSYPDLNQFGLTFMRAFLQLALDPNELNEKYKRLKQSSILRKHGITAGTGAQKMVDFLAHALIHPEHNDLLGENAGEIVQAMLRVLDSKSQNDLMIQAQQSSAATFLPRFQPNPNFSAAITGKGEPKKSKSAGLNILGLLTIYWKYDTGDTSSRWWQLGRKVWRRLYPTKWYERAIREAEKKEVSRILEQEQHVTLRDKQLAHEFAAGNKDRARELLIADSLTSDHLSVRMIAYLFKFDPLYKKTFGNEIAQESFDLMMLCQRNSEAKKIYGSKPLEFEPDGKGRYVYVHYNPRVINASREIKQYTERELLGAAKEQPEWMYYRDGSLISYGHKIGDPESAPPGKEWEYATGNLEELFGKHGAEQLGEFCRRAREVTGDEKFGTILDPVRVAYMAQLVSFSETPKSKVPWHEHTKQIHIELLAAMDGIPDTGSGDENKFSKLGPDMQKIVRKIGQPADEKKLAALEKEREALRAYMKEIDEHVSHSTGEVVDQRLHFDPLASSPSELHKVSSEIDTIIAEAERTDVKKEFRRVKIGEHEFAQTILEEFSSKIFTRSSEGEYPPRKDRKDGQGHVTQEGVGTLRAKLMEELRLNAPTWYQENQFKVQQIVGRLIEKLPPLREGAKIKKILKPYVEAAKKAEILTEAQIETANKQLDNALLTVQRAKITEPTQLMPYESRFDFEALEKAGVDTQSLKRTAHDIYGAREIIRERRIPRGRTEQEVKEELSQKLDEMENAIHATKESLLRTSTEKQELSTLLTLTHATYSAISHPERIGKVGEGGIPDLQSRKESYLKLKSAPEALKGPERIQTEEDLLEALKLTRLALQTELEDRKAKAKEKAESKKDKKEDEKKEEEDTSLD